MAPDQNHHQDREDDPLLDAMLSELFGSSAPRDLAPRILQALQQRAQSSTPPADSIPPSSGAGPAETPAGGAGERGPTIPWASVLGSSPAASNGESQAPGVNGQLRQFNGHAGPTIDAGAPPPRRGRRSLGLGYGVALALLLAAGAALALYQRHRGLELGPPQIAEEHGQPSSSGSDSPSLADRRPQDQPGEVDGIADSNRSRTPSSEVPPRLETPFGPQRDDPAGIVQRSNGDQPPVQGLAGLPSAKPDRDVVAALDQHLQAGWTDQRLTPSEPATDAEWCRRAFVRLLGRIPTVPELQNFAQSTHPDKRAQLVDQLVDGSHYAEEFALYWSTYWANTLIGRTAGLQKGDLANRQGFESYLRSAIAADRALHEVVYELVSATGSADPGTEDFNGAVNFLLAHHSSDRSVETAAVTRLFLGQRYQCAQCHDHPGNEQIAQREFWQFNALLQQVHVEHDKATKVARLVDRDQSEEAVFYERLDGVKRAAYPVLPDGQTLARSGKLADGRRREELARWIASSDALPKAVVNRVWAHFYGYGLTRPIDEIGTHNPGSHPELLDELSTQFAAHGYRLKPLAKWLALSDAFQRSSKFSEGNVADAPERGELPWFSRYYLRQMQPEAVFESLRLVAEARRKGDDVDRSTFLGQFAHRMGTDDGEESHSFQGDIRQSLLLMHGPLMAQALSSEQGAVLRHVLSGEMSPDEKITHLFLASVGRRPNQRELQQCLKMLEQNQRTEETLQDILWALLNSNEFILDR